MELLSNLPFVRAGNKVVLQAINGVAPYTYSVVAGQGDGGSINNDGVYTAPTLVNTGRQVIRATDDNNDTVDYTMLIYSELQILCYIISQYMGLAANQIYIYNTKINVPKDDKVYVAVKLISMKPYSQSRKTESSGDIETIGTNIMATVSIDVKGTKRDTISFAPQVLRALKSGLSQRIQTINSMHIASIPTSFNDLSQLEGPQIPYRFNINLNMHYNLKETKAIEYYDDFPDLDILKEQ